MVHALIEATPQPKGLEKSQYDAEEKEEEERARKISSFLSCQYVHKGQIRSFKSGTTVGLSPKKRRHHFHPNCWDSKKEQCAKETLQTKGQRTNQKFGSQATREESKTDHTENKTSPQLNRDHKAQQTRGKEKPDRRAFKNTQTAKKPNTESNQNKRRETQKNREQYRPEGSSQPFSWGQPMVVISSVFHGANKNARGNKAQEQKLLEMYTP